MRTILAAASVEGYLRQEKYKFMKEASDVPESSADLLRQVKEALKTIGLNNNAITVDDTFTETRVSLCIVRRRRSSLCCVSTALSKLDSKITQVN